MTIEEMLKKLDEEVLVRDPSLIQLALVVRELVVRLAKAEGGQDGL